MSGEESADMVNIDPRCIQEALRMYLQPIKNDDPKLDFYTMYRRETTEYDTEHMQKHNDDLNTTLIFAGLFSAVSSAFVISIQSGLQPDSGGRSEAYLQAILFSLNPSISPHENPVAPPPWSGPPPEIVTSTDLLYASLLMSLLAAFVAMLGKQWLNRYLQHTGRSMIERCGNRQRKCDGLEKWPFRLFIDSLPIMLQIALLLLACGLSRYTWSVNTSVARVVISFTLLGFVFYIGIVVVGTSSYECPFQTPVSLALQHLKDSGRTQKVVASLSLSNVIHAIFVIQKNIRKLLARLTLPSFTSFIYAAWMDAHQRLISAFGHVNDIARHPFPQEISLSRTLSGIRNLGRDIEHQAIILLLRTDRTLGDARQRLVQEIRSLRLSGILPITRDRNDQQVAPPDDPGLLVCVRELKTLRKQNTDNARCVCWVLRNITDPEAIERGIRLAGTIRWFDGNSTHDPPYDLIVSIFEACLDSTNQLHPSMRDQAYFSARAILQIRSGARARSDQFASRYPIPAILPSSFQHFQHSDPDLHNILHILEHNFGSHRPILSFPAVATGTHVHPLWVSNLFVDMTRRGSTPTLASYKSYLSAAVTDHRAVVANILLVWYMLLGGQVEEETFWAVDKSDSLEIILSHLSTRVTNIIINGDSVNYFLYLLEFLAAWKNRPEYLTRMACQWCFALSDCRAFGGHRQSTIILYHLRHTARHQEHHRSEAPTPGYHVTHSALIERDFSKTTLDYPSANTDAARSQAQHLTPDIYSCLLSITLEVGFRLAGTESEWECIPLDSTPHHERMLETAFRSDDDEVIADAVCMWIMNGVRTPLDSFARHFAKRIQRGVPFSPRLQRLSMRAIKCIWDSGFKMSGPKTVYLLNHVGIGGVDVDGAAKGNWALLLGDVIRGPAGLDYSPIIGTCWTGWLWAKCVPGLLDRATRR